MNRIAALLAVVLCALALGAQELNVNLTLNSDKVEGTNKQVFTTLENDLKDFLNSQQWTDMTFSDFERIDCNFMIIVNSYADDLMMCELQVQASRPVYNSSYTTTIFNFRDQDFNFTYKEFDPIEVNSSTYESNLTAVLAYYAYIIIGLDLDSYGSLGGSSMFTQAEQIVNMSQNRSNENEAKGWKAFDSNRNRYALVSNLNDSRFRPLREFFYTYHRQALDNMAANVDNGRAKIAAGLPVLRELNRENPNAILIISFLDAKNDELINIFKGHGTAEEKKSVNEILNDINPTASERYKEILE